MAYNNMTDWEYLEMLKASKLNLEINNIIDNHNRLDNIHNEIKPFIFFENYTNITSGHDFFDTSYPSVDYIALISEFKITLDVAESLDNYYFNNIYADYQPDNIRIRIVPIVAELSGYDIDFVNVIFIKRELFNLINL